MITRAAEDPRENLHMKRRYGELIHVAISFINQVEFSCLTHLFPSQTLRQIRLTESISDSGSGENPMNY